jgi:hypothetical protein
MSLSFGKVGEEPSVPKKEDGKEYKPFRFWMPKGSDAEITFLHEFEQGVNALEHCVQKNGDFRQSEYFVCLKHAGKKCPLCDINRDDRQVSSYFCNYFMIIDHREAVSSSGKTFVDTLKILPLKKNGLEQLRFLQEDIEKMGSTLRGARIKVQRGSDKTSPRTGSRWSYMEHVDLDEYDSAGKFPAESDESIQEYFQGLLEVDEERVEELARYVKDNPMIEKREEVSKSNGESETKEGVPWK